MIAQFVEDFVHFKGRQDGLDEDCGPDCTVRDAQFFLCQDEDVIPETGFQVTLKFGQVKIRAGTFFDQGFGVVEEVEGEVEDATGDWFAVDENVLFGEMPASRTYEECGCLFL